MPYRTSFPLAAAAVRLQARRQEVPKFRRSSSNVPSAACRAPSGGPFWRCRRYVMCNSPRILSSVPQRYSNAAREEMAGLHAMDSARGSRRSRACGAIKLRVSPPVAEPSQRLTGVAEALLASCCFPNGTLLSGPSLLQRPVPNNRPASRTVLIWEGRG